MERSRLWIVFCEGSLSFSTFGGMSIAGALAPRTSTSIEARSDKCGESKRASNAPNHIPRANTIIIDRADMFGLSQLYQLRGRVGRSRERAYCYLIVPPLNTISDEARSRVEAIEQHSELGSGFHIASLDLELRGSGDLLGAEQSGNVASVGFELFRQMLDAQPGCSAFAMNIR